MKGSDEYYYDLKFKYEREGVYNSPKIATDLENEFNETLMNDRDGKFKEINDQFYENMKLGISIILRIPTFIEYIS